MDFSLVVLALAAFMLLGNLIIRVIGEKRMQQVLALLR